MAKLHVYQKFCQIKEETNTKFLDELDNHLAFFIPGIQYSKAFRLGRFDGMKRLLTGDLKFPGGLQDKVAEFYQSRQKDLEIVDEKPLATPSQSIDIIPKLNSLGIFPYDYQLQTLEVMKQRARGIIKVATGGGKTTILALAIANFGKNSIVYVIGNDLLHQTRKFLTKVFNQKIGIIGDGQLEIENITVASVWTIGKSLGVKDIFVDSEEEKETELDSSKYEQIFKYLKTVRFHIFDECHLASCSTIQAIYTNIEPEHIYGMSASPVRDDNSELLIESVLGRNIVDYSASYLIEHGFLVPPMIKFVKVPKYPEKLKKNYHTIYSKYIIENEVRNKLVVDGTVKLCGLGYPTLVLFNNIKHGNILHDLLKDKVPCRLLSGKDDSDTREKVKQELMSGKIKCIIASKIYDIGVDIPILSGLVLAGGGKSSVRALQRIGRVIRKYPNKARACVIDFIDDCHFLNQHSKRRKELYEMESKFEVKA